MNTEPEEAVPVAEPAGEEADGELPIVQALVHEEFFAVRQQRGEHAIAN